MYYITAPSSERRLLVVAGLVLDSTLIINATVALPEYVVMAYIVMPMSSWDM